MPEIPEKLAKLRARFRAASPLAPLRGVPVVARTTMPLSALHPAEYNPRTIDAASLRGLTASIAQFGLVQDVVFNRRLHRVVGGHQRLKALAELGATEVPVSVVDLSENEEKLLNLALNNTAIQGDWTEQLDELLQQTRAALPDLYGSTRLQELEAIAAKLVAQAGTPAKPERSVCPEEPETPASVLGEIYAIGDGHLVMCGDARNPEHVSALMAGEHAALMVTDPPYGVNYTDEDRFKAQVATGTESGKGRKWVTEIALDTPEALRELLDSAFKNARDCALAPNAAWYVWFADRTHGVFSAALTGLEILVHRQIIWRKSSPSFGYGDYQFQHEPCFYGWKQGSRPPFYGERNQTTVWDVPDDTAHQNRSHPNMKPVALYETPIQNHTRQGDLVFDPFACSGTCLLGCMKTGRKARIMDIEPRWVDVVRRRATLYAKQQGIDPGSGALD